MMRALVVLTALGVAVGVVLARLWTRGFSVRTAIKMTALAAGFVVSVKMVLGGYLSLQGEAESGMVETVGLWASLGLALFFGIATHSLWRRGPSGPSPARPRSRK